MHTAAVAIAALALSAVSLSPPSGLSAAPGPAEAWQSAAETRQGASDEPAPRTATTHGQPGAGAGALPGVRPRAGWAWPLAPRPRVVRGFQRPASDYGSGHRGVDLSARPGQTVHAAAAGRTAFVGAIAGRGTVAVAHAGGVRTTYEPVSPIVSVGDLVVRGQPIGTLEPSGSHCDPVVCLHFGAIRGRAYLDPLALLGGAPVRLLPVG